MRNSIKPVASYLPESRTAPRNSFLITLLLLLCATGTVEHRSIVELKRGIESQNDCDNLL